MTIDGHVHVFLPHSERCPRTVGALAPPARSAPVQRLLDVMTSHDVARAVLVPLGPEDGYVADCLAANPGRFAAIGVADRAITGRLVGSDPVEALNARVRAGGFKGIRMNWLGNPRERLVDSPAFPALEFMAKRSLLLWLYAPTAQLPLVGELTTALPDLAIVLNHLGFFPDRFDIDAYARPHINSRIPPDTLETVISLARQPNVTVMLSGLYAFSREAYPYLDLQGVVTALYNSFGAERMFWASDFPWILDVPGYRSSLELPHWHLPNLTGSETEALMSGTVMRLFSGAWLP
ncbi:MAG TPA: amidohydrolase family protein [Acidimicrobiales bacterium]|nr:amidohydrolase family protein [Acidimicrobiales bacterium]